MAADIDLHQSRVSIHFRRKQPQVKKFQFEAGKECLKAFTPDALNKIGNRGMVKDLIIYSGKAAQRKAIFSEMARHRRQNEVMLYNAEMNMALTSTSVWIAGLPLSVE